MNNYYKEVRAILLNKPATRDDDMLLYATYCIDHGYISYFDSFWSVMSNAKQLGMPSYESITRTRRRVQEVENYLRGTNYKGRKDEEQNYREFYRGI